MYTSITANLMVENVERAIRLYRESLGFSLVTSVPDKNGNLQFAILEKDHFNLMFQERKSFIKEYPCLDTPKVKPSISLYIHVDNFDRTYEALKALCTIVSDTHATFYGIREFAITDYDGYVLTFAEQKTA